MPAPPRVRCTIPLPDLTATLTKEWYRRAAHTAAIGRRYPRRFLRNRMNQLVRSLLDGSRTASDAPLQVVAAALSYGSAEYRAVPLTPPMGEALLAVLAEFEVPDDVQQAAAAAVGAREWAAP